MVRRKATREELNKFWQKACDYWEHGPDEKKIDTPWIKASFQLKSFKVLLSQKGLYIPFELGG